MSFTPEQFMKGIALQLGFQIRTIARGGTQYGKNHTVRGVFFVSGIYGLTVPQVTFSELYSLSGYANDLRIDLEGAGLRLDHLHPKGDMGLNNTETPFKVALICSSNTNFIPAWLSLMRLGLPVLLIGPQNQPSSIVQLCQCYGDHDGAVKILYYDDDNESLAQDLSPMHCRRLPSMSETNMHLEKVPKHYSNALDIAYIHHSSGTSSGILKPIEQTHRGAAGALPRLDGRDKASFSTTPLYHGGIADCLRAWTSRAMIWLFPENEIPITASNVLKCLEFADSKTRSNAELGKVNGNVVSDGSVANGEHCESGATLSINASSVGRTPPVQYFSSVPYVLNIVTQENAGRTRLMSMELVGTGGTALSQSDGDKLVEEGIRLISRYGSAECGFLLSSNRHGDDDWQYIRVPKCSKYLHFEDMQDGLAELVVKNGWPHMAKRNLPDGSYATSDLFERHPSIDCAWKYHSRKDSQVTLSTGKKFDPEPLERSILAASKELRDVLVFGNGRSYAGALLFRDPNDGLDDEAYLDRLWPEIDVVNHGNPPHAQLQRIALKSKVVPRDLKCLPKSSKGTILRGQAEMQYKELLEEVYNGSLNGNNTSKTNDEDTPISRSSIRRIVAETVRSVLGKRINDDADLLRAGLKSQQSQEIRNNLIRRLLQNNPELRDKISLTVAYDQETIDGLSRYFERRLSDKLSDKDSDSDQEKADLQDMIRLKAIRISTIRSASAAPKEKQALVLTGATGTLGIHLLDKLRSSFPEHSIYCLLRSKEGQQASSAALRGRLSVILERRRKAPLSASDNVIAVSCKATEPRLGLGEKMYDELVATTNVIIHAAWDVNFVQPLRAYKDQFAWLVSLLELGHQATFSGEKDVGFFFCSSIASVGRISDPSKSESSSENPEDATPVGYSRSKWVAEHICHGACEDSKKDQKGLDVHVLRIGQLCGDTENGIWNMREAIPLLLSTKDILGCLPRQNLKLDWLPVDIAADTILDIIAKANATYETTSNGRSSLDGLESASQSRDSFCIYHVVNPRPDPSWNQMLQWLNEGQTDQFQMVDGYVWLQKLQGIFSDSKLKHPGKPLLPLWEQQYGQDKAEQGSNEAFDSTIARNASLTLKRAAESPVLTKDLVRKMAQWIDGEMGENIRSQSNR